MRANKIWAIGMPLFLCLASNGAAQGTGKSEYAVEGYSVTHYTDENGIPQNTVKEIVQDRHGFIWMATEYELIKFDGNYFTFFDIKELEKGDNDCLRLGTLFTLPFSDNVFVRLANCQKKTVRIIEIKPEGFVEVNLHTFEKHIQGLAYLARFLDIEYRPGLPWKVFPRSPHEYFYLNGKTVELRSTLTDKTIYDTPVSVAGGKHLICWNRRHLYLYTLDGIFWEITKNGARERLRFAGSKVVEWNKPAQQLFLLDRDENLYEIKQHLDGSLKPELLLKHLPANLDIASVLHLHKQKTVLVGSHTKGLLVYRKHSAKTHLANLPDYGSMTFSVYPYNDSCVISGKYQIVCKNGTVRQPNISLTKRLSNITQDSLGRYIASYDNLLRVFSENFVPLKQIHFKHKYVSALTRDAENTIWVAGQEVIYTFINDSLQFRFRVPAEVLSMKELVPGYLFMGTHKGLYIYSKSAKKYALVPHTENYTIRNVFRSRTGHFYLCAHGYGILLVTPNATVTKVCPDKKNALKYAHNMLQDRHGRLWISTNMGLFCIPETDLIESTLAGRQTLFYYYFSKKDGFATNEFNGLIQHSAVELPGGEMVFPSQGGLVFIHPDSAIFNFPLPNLQIRKLVVDDSTLQYRQNDTLRLSRGFNRFEVYLSIPNFGPRENVLLEYTFDDTDEDSWKPINRPLAFTYADPGYSTLYFRSTNGFGTDNYSYRHLVIYKPKAIWERRLFFPFVAAFVLLCGYIYFKIRTRNLRQRNKELAEAVESGRAEVMASFRSLAETSEKLNMKNKFQQWLISSVVHDLRGPLRFIKLHEEIRKDDNNITPDKVKFLKSVYFSSRKIYDYSENLIQLLKLEQNMYFKPEITDFRKLVEEKIEQFQETARWGNVNFVVYIGEEHEVYVNTVSLSIIIQNLLDNSLKNSPNGNIYISLKYIDGDSVINIRDEGPGLPPELLLKFNDRSLYEASAPQTSGIGLWLVHSLVRQTGGHISFKNPETGGLSITLTWN